MNLRRYAFCICSFFIITGCKESKSECLNIDMSEFLEKNEVTAPEDELFSETKLSEAKESAEIVEAIFKEAEEAKKAEVITEMDNREISECPNQQKIMLYRDEDGDGYGLNGMSVLSQESGEIEWQLYAFDVFCLEFNENGEPDIKATVKEHPGWVWMDKTMIADCNDKDLSIHPGTQEICNGIDDDCNITVDDIDKDGDFFLDGACGGDDCDDSDSMINQEAPEICDGIDHDCDGLVNEEDAIGCIYTCLCDPCDACQTPCLCP